MIEYLSEIEHTSILIVYRQDQKIFQKQRTSIQFLQIENIAGQWDILIILLTLNILQNLDNIDLMSSIKPPYVLRPED